MPTTRYFGKVCLKHPDKNGERRKANRQCVSCCNEARVILQKKNPEDKEKKKLRMKKYQSNNKEKSAEKMRRWREVNPEREERNRKNWLSLNLDRKKETNKKFRLLNRDKVNLYAARYRALKKNAKPIWANEFFIEESYHLAVLRNKVTGIEWHVDHIVPLNSTIVCGLHCEDNLQVIPKEINLSKSNRYWLDMP